MKYAVIVLAVFGNVFLGWSLAINIRSITQCGNSFANQSQRAHHNPSTWTYWHDDGLACYEGRTRRPILDNIRFSNTSRWADICGYWNQAVHCLMTILETSEDDPLMLENRIAIINSRTVDMNLPGSLVASIYHFPRRVCNNYQVKSDLTTLMNADLSCMKRSDEVDFYRCYETVDCELSHMNFAWGDQNIRLTKVIERLSAGALRCMRNVIENTECGTDAKDLLTFISELQMPSIVDVASLNVSGDTAVNFGSDDRCTVGVYGDPHLLYCNAHGLETCSAPGEQIYLSNSYMDIRGTNHEFFYYRHPKPTAIRKIAITFKSADGKTHVTTYTAENGNIPGTFENGQTTIGQGYDQVSIAAPSHYGVTFIQSSMGAILALRSNGQNYFFTLRMSSSVANASHGLLGTGCPPSQIINRNAILRGVKRDVTEQECINECEISVNQTRMQEICEYDCSVTRDLAFVNMSRDAIVDLMRVKLRDVELKRSAIEYEKSKQTTTPPSGASRITVFGTLTIPLLVLSQIFLTK